MDVLFCLYDLIKSQFPEKEGLTHPKEKSFFFLRVLLLNIIYYNII
jgi:hypothetical protein